MDIDYFINESASISIETDENDVRLATQENGKRLDDYDNHIYLATQITTYFGDLNIRPGNAYTIQVNITVTNCIGWWRIVTILSDGSIPNFEYDGRRIVIINSAAVLEAIQRTLLDYFGL